MVTKSVAKSGAKPVLQYRKKASCAFRRLPFIGKSAWDVPATGGYGGGCEFGVWAAVAYLKMLRAEEDTGGGFLQHIVLGMLERNATADDDHSFRGQVVGFFSTLDGALHSAAQADPRLDGYSERALAAAMTRAVNFDAEAWDVALQKLRDMGGEENVPFLCFKAYRRFDEPKAANDAEERAA